MLTIILKDNHEPNVVKFTYEQLAREVSDIPGADLIIAEDWFKALKKVKTRYVMLVESDCLVSSGYFSSLLGLIEKGTRRVAMLTSSTAVSTWAVKIYGYCLGDGPHMEGVIPVRHQQSRGVYPVQIGYLPGAIVRTNMLQDALKGIPADDSDLVKLSTLVSLAFWGAGEKRVHITPSSAYATTEKAVGNQLLFNPEATDVREMFKREGIGINDADE